MSSSTVSQLLYTGSGTVFSIAGKDVPKGEWKQVELPDQKNRVKFVTCDKTGSFSVIVDDKGASYFAGNNKKGENGEPGECRVAQDLTVLCVPHRSRGPATQDEEDK